MGKTRQWFKRRFRELDLLEIYFPLVFTRWQAALWGGSVLAVGWGIHFIVALTTPPAWVNWLAVLFALFFVGYYVWRVDHLKLISKFEVKEWFAQPTDTFENGKKNGWSFFYQLQPRCLTEANLEECRGFITSIEMWDGYKNDWEVVEKEVMFLEWSHENEKPTILYSGGEKRLNVFAIDNRNLQIMPRTIPFPVRFLTLFNQLELRQIKAIKFHIKIVAKDCSPVKLTMKVQVGSDPFKPIIDLEQIQ